MSLPYVPSTRSSRAWTLAPDGLMMRLFLLFLPGGILPDPCGPILDATAPPQLNVQANARLAAHLREAPAPHILEEDAEPNEDLAGDDFTYSQETTTTFQELLTLIDSNTRKLPSVLFPAHHAALTQLPLTYPWARLVLDLKELLLSFDRHLLTCLIANNVQGNATPHPGLSSQAFSSILRSSSCLSFPPMMPMTHRPFFTTRKFTTLNSGTRT